MSLGKAIQAIYENFPQIPWTTSNKQITTTDLQPLKDFVKENHAVFEQKNTDLFSDSENGSYKAYYLGGSSGANSTAEIIYCFNGTRQSQGIYPLIWICNWRSSEVKQDLYLRFTYGDQKYNKLSNASKRDFDILFNEINDAVKQELGWRGVENQNSLDVGKPSSPKQKLEPPFECLKIYDHSNVIFGDIEKDLVSVLQAAKRVFVSLGYKKRLANIFESIDKEESEEQIEETVNSLGSKKSKNLIFYGPPGTGKTYHIQQNYLVGNETSKFVTFHQSYSYEDFVEGIKPVLDKQAQDLKFTHKQGVFRLACEEAYKLALNGDGDHNDTLTKLLSIKPEGSSAEERKKHREKLKKHRADIFAKAPPYYLCIDEINRGNVSAIFGELITCIESSKRLGEPDEVIVTLPYSRDKFGVPPNLHIIGTMNTADRSVEALDTALRRRFTFQEMMPKYKDFDEDTQFGEFYNINMGDVLQTINQKIEMHLDRDHIIGHTYLINKKSEQEIKNAFANQIIPLLQEYFYNDYQKIAKVLGEGFIKRETSQNFENLFAFKSEIQHSLNADRWTIVTINDSFDLQSALNQLMCIKDDTPSEPST